VTRDHVPPDTLFAEPRPNDLITVPWCGACNKKFSWDDEYFRLKIGTNDAVRGHPDADKNLPVIMESLKRPLAAGFARSFLDSLTEVEFKDPFGRGVTKALGNAVDLNRIFRVVERCVRGLHFYVHGERMPNNYEFVTHNADTFIDLPLATQEHCRQNIINPVLAEPIKVVGAGVFAFRFQQAKDMPEHAAWYVQFYSSVWFLSMVGPRVMLRNGRIRKTRRR